MRKQNHAVTKGKGKQTEEKQGICMMFLCLNKNHNRNTYEGLDV
jgi:hypothetical protein